MNNRLFNNKNVFRIILIACAIIAIVVEAIVYGYNKKEVTIAKKQTSMDSERKVMVTSSVNADSDTIKSNPIRKPKYDVDSTKTKITDFKQREDMSFEALFEGNKLKCYYNFVLDPSCPSCEDGIAKAIIYWRNNRYKAVGSADWHTLSLQIHINENIDSKVIGRLTFDTPTDSGAMVTFNFRGTDYGVYYIR